MSIAICTPYNPPGLTSGIICVLVSTICDKIAAAVRIAEFYDMTYTVLEGGDTRGLYGYGEALEAENDVLIIDGYPKTRLMQLRLKELVSSKFFVIQKPGKHAATVKTPKYIILCVDEAKVLTTDYGDRRFDIHYPRFAEDKGYEVFL